DLIGDIDRRRDLNAQLASELQAAQQKLQLTLRDLAAGAPAAEPAALPLRPFRGVLPWPVDVPAASRSGRLAGGRGTASNGIQVPAEEGAAVQAVHEGTVAFASTFAGFGN